MFCLKLAAGEGQTDICRWLVKDLNQNVNHKDPAVGGNALKEAAFKGNTALCGFLNQLGADINIRANNGFTPIMAACQAGHLGTARRLHELGADVNLESKSGMFCLMLAAQKGHISICEWLIKDLKQNVNY